MTYIQLKKHGGGLEKKAPKKTKNKPSLVSLPSPLYDVESRLFTGLQSRPQSDYL